MTIIKRGALRVEALYFFFSAELVYLIYFFYSQALFYLLEEV